MIRAEDLVDIAAALHAGLVTESPEETGTVARSFGEWLMPNSVVALEGNLGTGKTTFVRGMARAWNIPEAVTSPTFNLFTVYRGSRQLIHFDAYRLASGADVDTLMIDDFLESPWCLAIEWPSHIDSWLPDDAIRLDFGIVSPGMHRISLRSPADGAS